MLLRGRQLNRILAAFAVVVSAILPYSIAGQSLPPSRPLTVQDIYKDGGLTGKPPEGLSWSPDQDDDRGRGLVPNPGRDDRHKENYPEYEATP